MAVAVADAAVAADPSETLPFAAVGGIDAEAAVGGGAAGDVGAAASFAVAAAVVAGVVDTLAVVAAAVVVVEDHCTSSLTVGEFEP